MSFESFANQVEDDGEPNSSLDIAGQAVRDFNHRTAGYMAVDRPGWRFAPDAYRAMGELTVLAGGLPQALQQIIGALRHELEFNLIAIDRGSTYDGNPAAAVDAASLAIERAMQAAHQLYMAVSAAQVAINAASYAGPESDLHDGPPRVSVWTSPGIPREQRRNGLFGTTYSASCTCGWPQLPAMVDRQTRAEAEGEAEEHARATGHLYEPPADWS